MVEYGGWILLGIVLVVLVAKGKVDLNDILQLYKLREANKDLQALATSLSGQLEEANKALVRANNEIKNLQHKVEDLTNQIKETGEKVVEQVKDSGKKVEETVKDSTSKVETTVKDTGKKVEDTIQDQTKAVNQKIDDTISHAREILDKYKGLLKK